MEELVVDFANWNLARSVEFPISCSASEDNQPSEINRSIDLELYFANYYRCHNMEDSKNYQNIIILLEEISNLDNLIKNVDRNYLAQNEIGNMDISHLMEIKNKYCYQYFDDEDIMIYRMNISNDKKELINIVAQNLKARLSGELLIENMMKNLVIQDYRIKEVNCDIGHPEIFVQLWNILTGIDNYYLSDMKESIKSQDMLILSQYFEQYFPLDLDHQILQIMETFKEDTQMNPLSEVYHNLSSLNLEFIILLNLCIKYLKTIYLYCEFHQIKWYQLPRYYVKIFLRLINNFGIILMEVGFNPVIS